MSSPKFRTIIFILAIFLGAVCAKYFGARLFPISVLVVGGFCFVFCWVGRAEYIRNFALLFGAAAIATGSVDIYLRATSPSNVIEITADAGLRNIYGTPSAKDRKFRSIAVTNERGKPVFDVVYTFDRNGYRKTGGASGEAPTYLFFGDSFTFGHGVDDEETIPSRFSATLAGKFNVVNLAYPGFGPHSMLRLIETNAFARSVTGKVRRCYFLAIRDHLRRAVGLSSWGWPSPQYTVGSDGRAQFSGLYMEHWLWRLIAAGGLPELVGRSLAEISYSPHYSVALTSAIFSRAAEILKQRYGAELVILLWDDDDVSELENALERRGLKPLRVSDFVTDIQDPSLQILKGIDHHPSPAADRIIGTALAQREQSAQ